MISHKASKPQYLYLNCTLALKLGRHLGSNVVERYNNSNYQSPDLATSRELSIKCLIGYCNEAQVSPPRPLFDEHIPNEVNDYIIWSTDHTVHYHATLIWILLSRDAFSQSVLLKKIEVDWNILPIWWWWWRWCQEEIHVSVVGHISPTQHCQTFAVTAKGQ